MFLEVVPSFSGMVFRCGEGYVLEAYSSSSCFVFNRIQKGRQAPGQRVFGRRSVLQWHGVSVWPRVRFGGLQQQELLCFEQDPEGTSSPGGTFWRPAAAAAAALFLTGSRRDVKPRGNVFLDVVPSFSFVLQWHGVSMWRRVRFGGVQQQQL